MDDRELTERAARASGKEVLGWIGDQIHTRDHADATPDIGQFDPLNDDGDALRLAVQLNLQVLIGQGPDGDITWVRAPEELDVEGPSERHGADAYAATRRAIVRAAAALATAKS
jgi:hypothetical protein